MKVIDRRFLRGPNLYARTPCLLALVEVDQGTAGGLAAACRLQRTMAEFHALAGMPGQFGQASAAHGNGMQFRVVCGYANEAVANAILDLAVDFINSRLEGTLESHAGGLRRLAREFPAPPPPRPAVPIIAITGTNGKTTTTLLVAHAVRLAGKTTAYATTQGIFIDGRRVREGDCTGYWSARHVLDDPTVEYAVLETARGGILKRGLGFPSCDVAVMLNVAADHLGLDGVDTIEALAQVKGVVTRSASRAVVLNAADRHCVAAGAALEPGVEVVYFSMDPDHPELMAHLARRGRAVYLHDGVLVLADGARQEQLLRVEHMPVTMGGKAGFNTANCLAAAAALMAAGFGKSEIAHGLASFVSDGRSNPLRANIFDVHGITVIADYAHNPAAYAAMAGMARSMARGRLVGIITAPGDRRDQELEEIGRVCAARFDEIIVYESSSRGRRMGGTVEAIVRGARALAAAARVHEEWVDVDAFRRGIAMCAPGDVLVFSCGTSLATLVEALRLADPEAAARIAADIA